MSDPAAHPGNSPAPAARLPRVVYAATSHDVATYGFGDLQFYRELTHPAGQRAIREDAAGGELREIAVAGPRDWTRQLPFAVQPKY